LLPLEPPFLDLLLLPFPDLLKEVVDGDPEGETEEGSLLGLFDGDRLGLDVG